MFAQFERIFHFFSIKFSLTPFAPPRNDAGAATDQ